MAKHAAMASKVAPPSSFVSHPKAPVPTETKTTDSPNRTTSIVLAPVKEGGNK
jgi:hypothetical protein